MNTNRTSRTRTLPYPPSVVRQSGPRVGNGGHGPIDARLGVAQCRFFERGMHHPAKAKRVIYLFMSGGPSHLDLWDYKPKLGEEFGKDLPDPCGTVSE